MGFTLRRQEERRPEDPRRAIKKARAVAIEEFPEGGVAKVVGRVRALSPPLEAPITGRACVCFHVRHSVGTHIPGPRRGESFMDDVAGQDFLIEDDSGTALVRHPGLAPVKTEEWKVRLDRATQVISTYPVKTDYLATQGEGARAYLERVLADGDEVAVVGRGVREADPNAAAGGYRDSAARVVIEGTPMQSVYLSNDRRVLSSSRVSARGGRVSAF